MNNEKKIVLPFVTKKEVMKIVESHAKQNPYGLVRTGKISQGRWHNFVGRLQAI